MIGIMPDEDLIAPPDVTTISQAKQRLTMTEADRWHKQRNEIAAMTEADALWAQGRWDECAETCYQVLRRDPSEAIEAKCHMYLATEEAGPKELGGRPWHAQRATELWRVVIERSGRSRYPIEKAKVQLEMAEDMLVQAEEAFNIACRLLQQQEQDAAVDGVEELVAAIA